MNNYERIKTMSVDEIALQMGAIHIAVIQKVADEIADIARIEKQLLPVADKKEIVDAIKLWLIEEVEDE